MGKTIKLGWLLGFVLVLDHPGHVVSTRATAKVLVYVATEPEPTLDAILCHSSPKRADPLAH